jgi:low affinity Fe/Cu permease
MRAPDPHLDPATFEQPPIRRHHIRQRFRRLAQVVVQASGSMWAFLAALTIVIGWACGGPIFHFSDTWQLIINTSSSIVTLIMVFLIQNAQNRDAKAIHLKLDELIRAMKGARNIMMDLESLSDEELDHLEMEFRRLREHAAGRGK